MSTLTGANYHSEDTAHKELVQEERERQFFLRFSCAVLTHLVRP